MFRRQSSESKRSEDSSQQDLQQYLAPRWQDRQQARNNSVTVFVHLALRRAIEDMEQHLEVVLAQQMLRLVVVEGSEDSGEFVRWNVSESERSEEAWASWSFL